MARGRSEVLSGRHPGCAGAPAPGRVSRPGLGQRARRRVRRAAGSRHAGHRPSPGPLARGRGRRHDRHDEPDRGRGHRHDDPPHHRAMLYTIVKSCARAIAQVLFRLQVRGREHIPRSGAVLLVANHSSLADPPLVGSVTPRPVSFLAKAELFEIPLFGGLIRRLNARPVHREGADLGAMRTALRVLERGETLLVFPEGTRGEEGVLRPGKAGAGMLAVLSGTAVVPVYIQGSGRAWPRGQRLPRPAKITVTFGAPLRFAAADGSPRSKKEAYEAASQAMMAAIARLKEAVQSQAPSATSPHEIAFGGVGHSTDGRNGQHGEG